MGMTTCSVLRLLLLCLVTSVLIQWLFTYLPQPVRRMPSGHFYKHHERVTIDVNLVVPFHNPTETYRYYSMPFCETHSTMAEEHRIAKEQDVELSDELYEPSKGPFPYDTRRRQGALPLALTWGESLIGYRRETTPYEVHFGVNSEWRLLCTKELRPADLIRLKNAIQNNYFFEMVVEDLPLWGYLGDVVGPHMTLGEWDDGTTYLFPHRHFYLGYNGDQIVAAKVATDVKRRVDITNVTVAKTVIFSYSVEFYEERDLMWKDRHLRYTDSKLTGSNSYEGHWSSIVNLLFLVVLLTIIMLQISPFKERNDDALEEEESGGKAIHDDVFRFPENSMLLCAAVGTGNHLLVATLLHLMLAAFKVIPMNSAGSFLADAVVLYCLSAFVGGCTAVRLYRQMNGENWVHCITLTLALFPIPVVVVFTFTNSVALAHGSTRALPFTSILTLTLFLVLAFHLTVLGGVMAKKYGTADLKAPQRINELTREIPTEKPWYTSRSFQFVFAGFLPCSAIYVDLQYIFASMWGHWPYTLFGFRIVAFLLLLLVVTSLITSVFSYFQLANEDHHQWWWTTFINGGMTGCFIYLYSLYYYFQFSAMEGFLQGSFYFGYMAISSLAVFLMLGSVALQFSLIFVRCFYSRVKSG